MKVLIYADFRSPHSRGWRDGASEAGIETIAISSEKVAEYDAESPRDWVSTRRQGFLDAEHGERKLSRTLVTRASKVQFAHSLLHLGRARMRQRQLESAIERHAPDLIHALRFPYEGITALGVRTTVPIVVSTWGSDFVPQASSDPLLRWMLRRAMPRLAGLQFDATIDVSRAHGYGMSTTIPTLFAAANLGVDTRQFSPDPDRPRGVVVYPRKIKENSNYLGFVEAATLLSDTGARFVGIGLEGIRDRMVERHGAAALESMTFTGALDREAMVRTMRSADVVVSPTFWDGMPITVLEALASGARVVAGDLPELSGLRDRGMPITLVDASDPRAIADAIRAALALGPLSGHERLPAEYDRVANGPRVRSFYETVIGRAR